MLDLAAVAEDDRTEIDDLHETPRLGTVLLAFTTVFFEAQSSYGQILLRQGKEKSRRGIHELAGPLGTGSAQRSCDGNPALIYARLLASRRRLTCRGPLASMCPKRGLLRARTT